MKRVPLAPGELGILAGMVRKVEFFSSLTVTQLEKVLPHVLLCDYKSGETVFRKGKPGDAFHIVYKGKVEIRLPRLLLPSKLAATLGPGQFFGEIALISDEPRTATVVCAEATKLFTLMASDFAFILRENREAAAELKAIAAQRKFITEHSS